MNLEKVLRQGFKFNLIGSILEQKNNILHDKSLKEHYYENN